MHKNHTYRNLVKSDALASFRVVVEETDLWVHALKPLEKITRNLILKYRGYIQSYIKKYPEFLKTMAPWQINDPAPLIIKDMITAGRAAGVGPMAAVAGAIAEYVGNELLIHPDGPDEVIVENGGDIFLKTPKPVTVGIYAGTSPLSMRIGLRINSENEPFSICTSSGTIGHSISMGKADAVSVVSTSCSLADAAATSIGNQVNSKSDIQTAINFAKTINGITGVAVIMNDQIGFGGKIEVVPL